MEVFVLTYIRTSATGNPLNRDCIVYKNADEAEQQAGWFRHWGYLDVTVIKTVFKG